MGNKVKLIGKHNPKLHKVCEEADVKEGRILAKHLLLYASKHSNLAGLAAPQVGILTRVFIFRKDNKLEIVINPTILEKSADTSFEYEGCVSIPGYTSIVERSKYIKVEYHNGEEKIMCDLSGFPSRCFQHEFDHLDGILYTDKITEKKTMYNLIARNLTLVEDVMVKK